MLQLYKKTYLYIKMSKNIPEDNIMYEPASNNDIIIIIIMKKFHSGPK